MDKNPDDVASKVRKMIFSSTLNSISFDNAITKTYFFHKLVAIAEIPAIYFDFDLLYSGYLAANILPQNQNLTIHQPREDTWKKILVDALEQISQRQHLVIIDSLNGFFTTLADQKDSGRIINSVIMLLAAIGQKTDSAVLAGSISKYKKDDGWILPAIGTRVVEIDKMNHIAIKKENLHLQLLLVDNNNFTKSALDLSDLDLV